MRNTVTDYATCKYKYAKHFGSIADFVAYADAKPTQMKGANSSTRWTRLDCDEGDEWFGGSWKDCVEKLTTHKNIDNYANIADDLLISLTPTLSPVKSWTYCKAMEEGDAIDIGRYMDGGEKYWTGVRKTRRAKPVVKVFFGFGGGAKRTAKELAVCGMTAVALTEALESAGYATELTAVCSASKVFTFGVKTPRNANWQTVSVRLKDSHEYTDVAMVNYFCGNAAVFRHGMFRTYMKMAEEVGCDTEYGMGFAQPISLDELGIPEEERATSILVPKIYDVEEARKWLASIMDNK